LNINIQRRRGLKLKKVKFGRKLQFPTESRKFHTYEIMGVQNFIFALKFPPPKKPKWGIASPKFSIFGSKFSENTIFRYCLIQARRRYHTKNTLQAMDCWR